MVPPGDIFGGIAVWVGAYLGPVVADEISGITINNQVFPLVPQRVGPCRLSYELTVGEPPFRRVSRAQTRSAWPHEPPACNGWKLVWSMERPFRSKTADCSHISTPR